MLCNLELFYFLHVNLVMPMISSILANLKKKKEFISRINNDLHKMNISMFGADRLGG